MYLIPHPDRTIPDPDRGGTLPPEGREVRHSTYWQRRIDDSDVTESTPPDADDVQTSALTQADDTAAG